MNKQSVINPFTSDLDLVNKSLEFANGDNLYTKPMYQTLSKANSITSEIVPSNTLCAKKIEVKEEITIEEIAVRINTAVVGNFVCGIYTLDSDGVPDQLIIQTTEFDSNIVGFQSKTISPTVLSKGEYVIASLSSASINFRCGSNLLTDPSFGLDFGGSGLNLNTFRSNLPYSSTLPTTCPSGVYQSKGVPLFVFKLS